jgi:phosphatidylinositol dimannoside acyltransferase
VGRDVFAERPGLRRGVFRTAFVLARVLPPWLARPLAFLFAYVAWFIDAAGRRTVTRNLGRFLPPRSDALSRTVRRSFINFCIATYESMAMARLPRRNFLPPNVTLVDPWGVFARKPVAGPVVLVMHHCHWELMLAVTHCLGLHDGVEAIALSSGDPWIDAQYERARGEYRCRTLMLDRGAPLASLRALKEGKVVGVVAERDYTGTGLRMRFAGGTVSMPVGAAALAVQCQAPIVPHLLVRRGWTRWTLVIGRPLVPDPNAPKQRETAELTRALAATFARFIAVAPSQWVAFHDHWAADPGRAAG